MAESCNNQRGVLEDGTSHTTLTSIGNGGVELAILGCRFSNSQLEDQLVLVR
nr:hypothetical protein [Nostoc sp. DedVER01b]MDZ8113993.1 hypothetical protein [Nostoc sp. DedVER01b]